MITPDTDARLALAALPDIAGDDLAALHQRLTDTAAQAELLDVAYRTVDSPVGLLLLAATPAGLVRVAFSTEDHDAVLATLGRQVSPRILHAPARLDGAARELAEYFAGQRRAFEVPLDWQLTAGFRRAVLGELTRISYGATASYGALAAAAGSPGAARAVGTACATNPLPLVIPCHRAVRADGSAGGYRGGPAAKRLLLALEAA